MAWFQNMGITKKAILIGLLVCLLPLFMGFGLVFRLCADRLDLHTREFTNAFSAQITSNLDHIIRDYRSLSLSILVDNDLFFQSEKQSRTTTDQVGDYGNMQKVLFRVATFRPEISTASILMNNGSFIQTGADGLKIEQAELMKEPWAADLENSPENFFIVPMHRAGYRNRSREDQTITFVRQIKSSGVRYLGSLLIDVDPDSIIVSNTEYEQAKQKYGILVRITDADGNTVYDSYREEHPEDAAAPEPFGSDYIVLERQSQELGLTVLTAMPRASLVLEQNYIRIMIGLIALLCGAAVAALMIPVSRVFTRRLVSLSFGMSRMKNGEYITVPESSSRDELGELVSTYNHMVREMQELIDKVYVAELVKKESAIVALQSQINPHMLFNTLEAIRMRALFGGDPDVAKMIAILAKMFRTVLDSRGKTHVVRDELNYAKEFLRLQNLRSGDMFSLDCDVEEELMDMHCIPILFQPLIENCIEHGRRDSDTPLNMRLMGRRQGDLAVFRIRDDGCGMDEESLQRARDRLEEARRAPDPLFSVGETGAKNIGLTNILMRIRLENEECGDLQIISSDSSGTCIELRIKAIREEAQRDEDRDRG